MQAKEKGIKNMVNCVNTEQLATNLLYLCLNQAKRL